MTRDNGRAILHIGMQRTASTFLQRNVFPLLGVNLKIGIALDNISDVELSTSNITLISNENLHCDMWGANDTRYKRAIRLYKMFSKAKVLYGVRDKRELLRSWYNKYVVNGGVLSLVEVLHKRIINVDKLEWEPYVRFLRDLFEDVYVYHLDELKEDAEEFVRDICSWMGIEAPDFRNKRINQSYNWWQLKASRLLNRFFKTKMNPDGIIPLHHWYLPHRLVFLHQFME